MLCLILWWFLIEFLLEIDAKCFSGGLVSPLSWLLIKFLFKSNAKCSYGCLVFYCGGFIFNSYQTERVWAQICHHAFCM